MRPGHAEIVGGGFGGLVAAAALAERGWSVRLHERRGVIDAEGYGIAVQPNMMLIFRALGIADEVIAGGARIDRRDSLDGAGNVVLTRKTERSPYRIDRRHIVRLLARRAVRGGCRDQAGFARHRHLSRRNRRTRRRRPDRRRSHRARRRGGIVASRLSRPAQASDLAARRRGQGHHPPHGRGNRGGRCLRHGDDRGLVGEPPGALLPGQRRRELRPAGFSDRRRGGQGDADRPGRLVAILSRVARLPRPRRRGGGLGRGALGAVPDRPPQALVEGPRGGAGGCRARDAALSGARRGPRDDERVGARGSRSTRKRTCLRRSARGSGASGRSPSTPSAGRGSTATRSSCPVSSSGCRSPPNGASRGSAGNICTRRMSSRPAAPIWRRATNPHFSPVSWPARRCPADRAGEPRGAMRGHRASGSTHPVGRTAPPEGSRPGARPRRCGPRP